MAEHWIPASKAIGIVTDAIALCSRLHAGLLLARAELLIIDHKEERSAAIPNGFWWSEGHAALEQNWQTGDFETWIDHKIHCKAFGVTIALSGILEMVPFEKRALLARSLSVAGDPDWVSAKEARLLSFKTSNPAKAGDAILELARLGFVSGRAVKLEAYRQGPSEFETLWEQREWDIEPFNTSCSLASIFIVDHWQHWKTQRPCRRNLASKSADANRLMIGPLQAA
jgi:hypothetical protein